MSTTKSSPNSRNALPNPTTTLEITADTLQELESEPRKAPLSEYQIALLLDNTSYAYSAITSEDTPEELLYLIAELQQLQTDTHKDLAQLSNLAQTAASKLQ